MHIPCGYSVTTCYSYDKSLNKTKYYRGVDCVEKFSQDLKKILNNRMYFQEKPMLPLTDILRVPLHVEVKILKNILVFL